MRPLILITIILVTCSLFGQDSVQSNSQIEKTQTPLVPKVIEDKYASYNSAKSNSMSEVSIWSKTETYKDIFLMLSPILIILWTTHKENKFNRDKHDRDIQLTNLKNKHQLEITDKSKEHQKELDKLKHELEIEKSKIHNKLTISKDSSVEQKESSKKIHASLTRMLFKVQNLYLKLSTSCADKNCLEDEIIKFESGFSQCCEEISDHMIFAQPESINNVYSFFQFLGLLTNELKSIQQAGEDEFDKAHSSVFLFSSALAKCLISIQREIVISDPNYKYDYNSENLNEMIYCCGTTPTEQKLIEYCKIYPEPIGIKEDYLTTTIEAVV